MKLIVTLACLFVFELNATAQLPRLVLPLGHTHKITVAAFNPAGNKVVTGSEDKTLKIWDVQTGRLLSDLKGHVGDIHHVAYNLQGDRIISTAELDSSAILWNALTGTMVKKITPSRYYVGFAKFSPNGKMFIVDGTRDIYSSETGERIITLPGYRSIEEALFTPDSRNLIVAEDYKTVVYDLATGNSLRTMEGADPIAITPDGRHIVSSSYDKKAFLYEVSGGALVTELALGEKPHSVLMSPDGKTAVIHELRSEKFSLWRLEDRAVKGNLGTGYSSAKLLYSEDGSTLYISDGINETRAYDTKDGKRQPFIKNGLLAGLTGSPPLMVLNEGYGKPVLFDGTRKLELEAGSGFHAVFFDREGSRFIGSYDNGKAGIWDLNNGRKLADLSGFARRVSDVEKSGNHYAVQLDDEVNLLALRNNLLKPLPVPMNDRPDRVFFSPDGRHMVSIVKDNNRPSVFDPEKLVSLWDLQTGILLKKNLWEWDLRIQDISRANAGSHQFSADGKRFFVWNELGYCYIFSIPEGKLLQTIETPRLWHASVDPSFSRLAYQLAPMNTDQPATIVIRDLGTGEIIREINADAHGWEKFRLLNGLERLLVYDVPDISLYDLKKKNPLAKIPNGQNAITPDQRRILIVQYDKVGVWDLVTGQRIFEIGKGSGADFWTAEWAPGYQQVVVSRNNRTIQVLDAVTGKQVAEMNAFGTTLKFSSSGKWMFAAFREQLSIFRSSDWSLISELNGHAHNITDVFETSSGKSVISFAEDNTARLWDIATGKLLYSQLILDKELQFTLLPDGNYMANPEASKVLHFVSPELNVVSFEQLDIRYNRPDLVLKTVDPDNAPLIRSYHSAWKKRLKKLGIDSSRLTGDFSVPLARISNRDSISFEQDSRDLRLQLAASDSQFALRSFNLWVNESPVFGQKGIAVSGGRRQSLDTVINIILSNGRNVIEFSVTNAAGAESYRMPLEVNHTGTSKGITRFIGFGVDTYQDRKYDLLFSVEDIRDLATALKERLGDELRVDTLFNAGLTRPAIEKLKASLLKGSVDDRVILAYSGHGLLSDAFDYYLSLPSTNFDKPEQGSLAYEELESLLDGIPARQKLFLIDACHSGEVDKDDLRKLNETPDSLVKGLKPVAYKEEGQLGLANSFELMQTIFANVGKGTGATVISAAAGTQFALERSDLRNGVFTFSILELMRSTDNARVSELKKYVAQRVVQLTKALQRPTFRNESRDIDCNVW